MSGGSSGTFWVTDGSTSQRSWSLPTGWCYSTHPQHRPQPAAGCRRDRRRRGRQQHRDAPGLLPSPRRPRRGRLAVRECRSGSGTRRLARFCSGMTTWARLRTLLCRTRGRTSSAGTYEGSPPATTSPCTSGTSLTSRPVQGRPWQALTQCLISCGTGRTPGLA